MLKMIFRDIAQSKDLRRCFLIGDSNIALRQEATEPLSDVAGSISSRLPGKLLVLQIAE